MRKGRSLANGSGRVEGHHSGDYPDGEISSLATLIALELDRGASILYM